MGKIKPHIFNVADYLLTRLKQLNVDHVFQIPGDYVKNFTQTLEHFKGIQTIGAINELDAGYAADAYGRTRGLAAISLQYGVSTFSALNAIAGAYVERSPIVVISATPGAADRKITEMYEMLFHHSTGNLKADQQVFKHVTVASETLSSSEGAPEKIDNLLIAAITHHRPVYIACYEEVWGEPCPPPPKKPLEPMEIKSETAQLNNAVEAAWTQITAKTIKNPMIFAGVELLRMGLAPLLQELIDASGFLYTTTTLGKTVLDEKGKKFIGTYADQASIKQVIGLVEKSDCFLTLGTIITDDYLAFIESKYAQMVLANTAQVRVGYSIFKNVTMKDFMVALINRFKSNKNYPLKTLAPPQPVYPRPWIANEDPFFKYGPDKITFNRFFQHSMKFLQDNKMLEEIVMTLGVSSALYVATNAYGMCQNSFLSSAAWQCIGFETGAAAGAQLGSGKRAWTIAGDGGFRMVCQSLSTLARYKLNAVIFVMNNGVYAIEQVYVNIESFKHKKGPQYEFDEFDILHKWDYMALAKAFGARGFQAKNIKELNEVLKEVRDIKDQPALVEIIIPEKELPAQMYRLEALG